MSKETLKKATALITMINDGVTEEELALPKEIRDTLFVLRAVNPDMYIYVEKGDKDGDFMDKTFIKFYPRIFSDMRCGKELCETVATERNPFFGEIKSPVSMLRHIGFKARQFNKHFSDEEALDVYLKANPHAGAGRILNFVGFLYPEAVDAYKEFSESCSEYISLYESKKEKTDNKRKLNIA